METIKLGTLVSLEILGTVTGYRLIDRKIYTQVTFSESGATCLHDILEVPETAILPVESPREA